MTAVSALAWRKSSAGHWVLLIKDTALVRASGQPSGPLLLLIKGRQNELVGLKCSTYNLPEKAAWHTSDNGIDFFFHRQSARAINSVEKATCIGTGGSKVHPSVIT